MTSKEISSIKLSNHARMDRVVLRFPVGALSNLIWTISKVALKLTDDGAMALAMAA